MNVLPIRHALFFRIDHAIEPFQEARRGVNRVQVHVEVPAERILHLLPLAFAQQAVVHKDAVELIADGAVNERSRDRRVDAPGEAENDVVVAYRSRMAAVFSSMNDAGVQSPWQPHIS